MPRGAAKTENHSVSVRRCKVQLWKSFSFLTYLPPIFNVLLFPMGRYPLGTAAHRILGPVDCPRQKKTRFYTNNRPLPVSVPRHQGLSIICRQGCVSTRSICGGVRALTQLPHAHEVVSEAGHGVPLSLSHPLLPFLSTPGEHRESGKGSTFTATLLKRSTVHRCLTLWST